MVKKQKTDEMEKIIQVLIKEGIDIPDDFEEKLEYSAKRHYSGKLPKEKFIKNAITAASYWEKYCANESEYSKLVCQAIYAMAEINAVTISSIPGLKSYVGNFCKLKEDIKVPENTTTIASDWKTGIVYYGSSAAGTSL